MPRPDSVFEADCPRCGSPLTTSTSALAVEGLIWQCAGCGFRSERSGGILLDTSGGPRRGDR